VLRLEQDANKVRAVAKLRSGERHTFEADRLICTIPFPALRGIETAPAFSAAKRKAINELVYDTIVRTAMQCRTRFWEKDGTNGFGHSDTPQQFWHFTHDQPGPRGLLMSYISGPIGEVVGDMEPEQRDRFIIDEMEKAHPGLKGQLENLYVKIWHKDPWTKGALGFGAPGQMTSLMIGAEKPEGRVHFAGEHLSRLQGWIQGALESGLRAVAEINAA
jgi:monoamine oxidase